MAGLLRPDELAAIQASVLSTLKDPVTVLRDDVPVLISVCRVDDAGETTLPGMHASILPVRRWRITLPDQSDVRIGDSLAVDQRGTYVVASTTNPTTYSTGTTCYSYQILDAAGIPVSAALPSTLLTSLSATTLIRDTPASVLRAIRTSDGMGGSLEEWVEITTPLCRVTAQSAQLTEAIHLERLEVQQRFSIAFDAGTDVTIRDRISTLGGLFEVAGVLAPESVEMERVCQCIRIVS